MLFLRPHIRHLVKKLRIYNTFNSVCVPTRPSDSVASDASDLGNLTFTYEEEADPQVFCDPIALYLSLFHNIRLGYAGWYFVNNNN